MCVHDQRRISEQAHQHGGDQPGQGCGSCCTMIADQRNRYYTGKYMTARDFRDEQAYFLSHHRLHNRLLHGWGVVYGLEVAYHETRACRDQHVVVNAGTAIDCCGRELFLHTKTAIQIWPPKQTANQAEVPAGEPPATLQVLLFLAYGEHELDCVPALYDDECKPGRMQANRIHEFAYLDSVIWDTAQRSEPGKHGCWPDPSANLVPCSKGCGATPGTESGLVEPACTCTLGVPLALITLQRTGDTYAILPEHGISTRGRKTLQPPQEYLTRIVKTNWEHGAIIPLGQIARPTNPAEKEQANPGWDGKLKIYFDRKLAPVAQEASAPAEQFRPPWNPEQKRESRRERRARQYGATGINRSTFVVEVLDPDGDELKQTRLYDDENPPYWDEKECAAVFTISDNWLQGEDDTLAGHLVHITLKCDFVLDCNNLAVDGDFLRGNFPSGDGIEGGIFESWFWVSDDGAGRQYYRDEARRQRDYAAHSATTMGRG